jgi:hypothetical protein
MTRHLTSVENLALSLVFSAVGEEQINRSTADYLAIARRLPPLRILVGLVNDELRQRHKRGEVPLAICRFRGRGERYIRYDPVPTSISIETIRTALNLSGMRIARRRVKSKH